MDPTSSIARGRAFAAEVIRGVREDRVSGLGAEIAFFAILGVLPTLLALASVLGWLDDVFGANVADRVENEVVDFFEDVFVSEDDGPVTSIQTLFSDARPGVFTLSLLTAVWAIGRSFAAVIRGLDLVYDSSERRSWIGTRLTALTLGVVSTVAASLVLVLLVVGPLIGPGRDIADLLGAGSAVASAWDVVRAPAAVLVLIGWAATVFHIAPSGRTPWRWELPGALVAAACWGVTTVGFRVYLSVAGGGNDVTGTLGGAVAMILWLYLLALGFLVGGEVNAVLAGRRGLVEDRPRRIGEAVEGSAGRLATWFRRQES